MTVVDLHTHVVPQTLISALSADSARFRVPGELKNGIRTVEHDGRPHWDTNGRLKEIERELYDTDAKVAEMDRMGVDVSALSVAPPTYFYDLGVEDGVHASRLSNDGIAAMVQEYPERLRGLATLPMQDPSAAIEELDRMVDVPGFVGVEMGASIEGRTLEDMRFRPVLKAITERGWFVLTHPNKCVATGGMEGFDLFNAIGFPLDEVIMASRLMLSGAMDDVPDLRIVIPHGGGYLPYQIGRLECVHRNRPVARTGTATSPRELFGRFYFDALTHDPVALRMLIDLVGADHVVIGSDHPFDMGYADPVSELDKVPGLTAHEREMITNGTAMSLMGEAAVRVAVDR